MQSFIETEQSDRAREYEYKGTRWFLRSYNPYGLWRVIAKEGATPISLQGQYTSFIVAEQDIQRYVNERDKPKPEPIKKVKLTPKDPAYREA